MAGAINNFGSAQFSNNCTKWSPGAKSESGEASRDLVIISPPSKDTPQSVLDFRIAVDNRMLEPDPQTGQLPFEVLVVKSDPKLADLPSAYIGNPRREPQAGKGQVIVPAFIPMDQADYDQGLNNFHAAIIKPNEEVVEKGAVQKAREEASAKALPAGMVGEVAPSGHGIPMPGIIKDKLGVESISYDAIQKGVRAAGELGATVADVDLAMSWGGWNGYLAAAAGPVMLLNGLETLKNVADHREFVHTQARAHGTSELPFTVTRDGKHASFPISTDIEALDQSFDSVRNTALGKVVQGGLVTAAGITSLMGNPVAPYLALGGLGVNSGVTLFNAKSTLSQLNAEEKDLKAQLAEGKHTVAQEKPIYKFRTEGGQLVTDRNGTPIRDIVGSRKVEVPIQARLDIIAEQKGKVALSLPQSLAMVASPAVSLLTTIPFMTVAQSVGGVSMGLMAAKEGFDAYKLHQKKAELEDLRDSGQTTIKQWRTQVDDTGSVTGSKEIEIPIDSQIKLLDNKIHAGTLKASAFGAGAGAMGAIGLGASVLSVTGALAVPAGVYAFQQISGIKDLRDEKKELLELQRGGATTFKKLELATDELGNISGVKEVDLPIADRLQDINKSMKIGKLKAASALTVAGAAVGVAVGAPLLYVAAGLAVVPALAAVVFMPKETGALFAKAGHFISESLGKVGHQIAQLWPFGKKEADDGLSPATRQLQSAHKQLAKIDEGSANQLLELAQRLPLCQDPAEREKLTASYDEALTSLTARDPDVAGQWQDAMQALQREGMEAAQKQSKEQAEKLAPQAEAFRQSFSASDKAGIEATLQGELAPVLHDGGIQSMAKHLGVSQDEVTDLARLMARAGLKGDTVELQVLQALAQSGDQQALKQIQLYSALQQAAQAHAQPGAVELQKAAAELAAKLPQLQAQSDALIQSITPQESAVVDDFLKNDPSLSRALTSLEQAGVLPKLDANEADMADAAKVWMRANVKQDPSEINLLSAKAQLGDAQAQKQVALAGAIEEVYRHILQEGPPTAQ